MAITILLCQVHWMMVLGQDELGCAEYQEQTTGGYFHCFNIASAYCNSGDRGLLNFDNVVLEINRKGLS